MSFPPFCRLPDWLEMFLTPARNMRIRRPFLNLNRYDKHNVSSFSTQLVLVQMRDLPG
jgi:hypothetical protein